MVSPLEQALYFFFYFRHLRKKGFSECLGFVFIVREFLLTYFQR
jgi:hypothetical protein